MSHHRALTLEHRELLARVSDDVLDAVAATSLDSREARRLSAAAEPRAAVGIQRPHHETVVCLLGEDGSELVLSDSPVTFNEGGHPRLLVESVRDALEVWSDEPDAEVVYWRVGGVIDGEDGLLAPGPRWIGTPDDRRPVRIVRRDHGVTAAIQAARLAHVLADQGCAPETHATVSRLPVRELGWLSAAPLDRARAVTTHDEAAALLADRLFLATLHVGGPSTSTRVHNALRQWGVTKKSLEEALRIFRRAATATRSEDAGSRQGSEPSGRFHYFNQGGRMCVRDLVSEVTTTLTTFTAWVVEERQRPAPASGELKRSWLLEGRLLDGTPLPQIEVMVDTLRADDWPLEKWGRKALIASGKQNTQHVRTALMWLGDDCPQVTIHTHTGWAASEPPVFLHAGGAIGGCDHRTELEGRLRHFSLPPEPEDAVEAFRTSLRFLDVAKPTITVALLAAVGRAPLVSWLGCPFVLWLSGHSGSLKSSLAGLAASHFGTFTGTVHLCTWDDTAASIESLLHDAKDVLAVIDDYAPASGGERLVHKAQSIVRAVGNEGSRHRMNTNMTMQKARPARALTVATGEDTPGGESITARLIVCTVERGDIDLSLLSELQDKSDRLPQALAAYVLWLSEHHAELRPALAQRARRLLDELALEEAHLRTGPNLANLYLGLDLYLEHGESIGAITPKERRALIATATKAMRELAATQIAEQQGADQADLFLTTLSEMIAGGQVYLERKLCHPGNQVGAPCVGWHDIGTDPLHVWLLPTVVYAAVVGRIRSLGRGFGLGQRTLWRSLADRGLLTRPGELRRFTHQRTVGDTRQRVLLLKVETVGLPGPATSGLPSDHHIPFNIGGEEE